MLDINIPYPCSLYMYIILTCFNVDIKNRKLITILNQTTNFTHVLKQKSIELTQNTLKNMLMSFDIMRSLGLQYGHINVFLCYRHNAICTERVNFVFKTYLVVFKNLFSICKLNITKYLLFNHVLNMTSITKINNFSLNATL